jgi:hypothetical protein
MDFIHSIAQQDLVIASEMVESSEIALASPSRFDASGTVREMFSRWTDELRGLREVRRTEHSRSGGRVSSLLNMNV